MLKDEFLEIEIKGNVKYYESLNYEIPKYKDDHYRWKVKKGTKIIVKIEDIPKKSHTKIPVVCDYCGEIYFPRINDYYNGHKTISKDSCDKCKNQKIQEIYFLKYGTNSIITRGEIQGFKVGRNRTDFDIVYSDFLDHGLVLQIDEKEYVSASVPLPYICNSHKEYGIQYKTHGSLKSSMFCCEQGAFISRRGEGNYNWKGGLSSEDEIFRKSIAYKEWRLEVFKRDNFTCQCCGDNTGGNLQAHHMENFSDNEELRLELDNGTTLCDSCHNFNKYGSFHHVYGTHNNTKEQLEEYIQRHKLGEFDELKLKNNIA